jgi:ComF family protein
MFYLIPKSPVLVQDIFVLWNYDNRVVKLLIKTLKYKNNYAVKKRLAAYLYEEIMDISQEMALFGGSPPTVLPMPMSKKEKNKKGFNQCEELLHEIEKLAGSSIKFSYNTLKKTRETERQTLLSREERLTNVKHSMVANIKESDGKNFIVIDDVYTTLSSFNEAKRVLIEAGARRVVGLFIAH